MALAAAFVFQAVALHDGQLSVVQPLLATELVFMLVLRRFWIRQSIRPVTWAAGAVTCVGLTVFIIAGQPAGGQPTATSQHWFTAGLACCADAAVLAVLAQWGSPSRRACFYASAAAVMWALVATFIKATTHTLTQFGVGGMFTHWPIYAVAVGSVAALFLEQAALHVGPLRASQPFLVIVDPIVSITLGVWLYGQHFTASGAVLAVAAAAFAVMCGGVVLLTQTAPATMKADTPTTRRAAGGMARHVRRAGRPRAGQSDDVPSSRPSARAGQKAPGGVPRPVLIGAPEART